MSRHKVSEVAGCPFAENTVTTKSYPLSRSSLEAGHPPMLYARDPTTAHVEGRHAGACHTHYPDA